jgi:hypothetical protein
MDGRSRAVRSRYRHTLPLAPGSCSGDGASCTGHGGSGHYADQPDRDPLNQTQRLQQAEIILQSSLGGSRLQPVEDVLDHPPLADRREGERGQLNEHWSPKIASSAWRWGKMGKKRQGRYGIGARLARSLSEYSAVLAHVLRISLGSGLVGRSPALGAHYPPQHSRALLERRQIFRRLWVKQISCHSADTFSSPRNRNVRIPRADLI